jgi:hypothetical protein
MRLITAIRSQAARLLAVMLIVLLYLCAQQPEISQAERRTLAGNFHFSRLPLAELSGPASKTIRTVNPSVERIAAWVSATGASVALNDLDGNGLPDDVCSVDPRTDQVVVAPVPGTGDRYRPFALDAGPLYQPSTMAPMGCAPADLNEDGLTDILVYYWGRTPLAFLAKRQPLSVNTYQPQEIIADGGSWFTGAATLADLDGDGHLDIVIGNYYPDGACMLDANARNMESMQHSMTRAFNGGRSRLLRFVGATAGAQPSVRYEEVQDYVDGTPEEKKRLTHGWTLAVGAADLDEDLLPELYFANDFGPDRLLHNLSTPGHFRFVSVEGTRTLVTPNSKVLGRDSFKGMGVDFADINNDGLFDIYVSNIAAEYALEESHFVFINTGETKSMEHGVAPFIDRSEELGLSRSSWSWESKLGDFNNDGILEALQATGFVSGEVNCWPELHELAMGNDQLLEHPQSWFRVNKRCGLSDKGHNPFFVRASDGRYYDLAPELGLDQSQISRGIATADVDGDGRLDYAVANQWESSYFYHNDGAKRGAFLGLRLRLPLSTVQGSPTRVCRGSLRTSAPTLAAIGAWASVRLPDGKRLVSQVDGGNGHSGKRSPELHFGLGELPADRKLQVEIHWRDRAGTVNRQTLELSPGWQTITLGQAGGGDNGCE